MKKVKKGLQDIGIMEIVETSRTWCTVECIYRHPLAASIKCRPYETVERKMLYVRVFKNIF